MTCGSRSNWRTDERTARVLDQDFVAMMVYGEVVSFDQAITTVSDLVEAAWP